MTTPVPEAKQTCLGLYTTASAAYEKWKADPDAVKIIDVRTPEEYLFVGHLAMAWNIPIAAQSYQWDDDKKQLPMQSLSDFVSRVCTIASTEDKLLILCRSGGRSAMAVNLLAKAGFKRAYNVIDGIEGDVVKDPESVFHGMRLRNGWKNAGCPWTYDVDTTKTLWSKA